MIQSKESIKIDIRHKNAKGIFWLVRFVDHDHHISYIPSLNVSAYGDSPEEADAMLNDIVLKDFFEGLFSIENENMIFTELKKLGWEKSIFHKKDMSRSAHIDNEGILREFNLPKETTIAKELFAVV